MLPKKYHLRTHSSGALGDRAAPDRELGSEASLIQA